MAAFANSTWDRSIRGKRTMRACDHQALFNGYWAEVVRAPRAAPNTPSRSPATRQGSLFPSTCK